VNRAATAPAPALRGRAARRTVGTPAETLADPTTRAAIRARTVVAALGRLGDSSDVRTTAGAWFADLRLGPALERSIVAAGRSDAPVAVHRTWLLLRLPSPTVPVPKAGAGTGRSKASADAAAAIASGWLADHDIRTFLGVHDAGGTTWLRAEALATLAAWTVALAAVDGGDASVVDVLDRVVGAAVKAGYALDRWLAAIEGGPRKPATEGAAEDPALVRGSPPRKPPGRRGDRTRR
jgi:hypothetical protein